MIVCIIQARMNSTRLPGKVLKRILGKPMLLHQIERVRRAKLIDKIIIATTLEREDNPIAELGKNAGAKVYRGSENDVLDRYYKAACEGKADIVVRLTADCPLSDPAVIDGTIKHFLDGRPEIDYASKPTNYPEGLDIEIFSFDALERAWKESEKLSEREHVTPYIYNHPEIFKVKSWTKGKEENSKMHWSVDTPKDFKFITRIFEELYPDNHFFSFYDVLNLLKDRPELLEINKNGTGYEGYAKSLKEDATFEEKRNLYEKIIGFAPECIVVLSAGTLKEVGEDGTVNYRSTRADEGDSFGTLFGEARVIAAAELAEHFPQSKVITTSLRSPSEPTHARIIRGELEKLSISPERIILEEKSNNTLSQIGEVMKIVFENKWIHVAMVTNEYQVARAGALYEHFEKLTADEETKRVVAEVKAQGLRVAFVGAEIILPHRDESFIGIIKKIKKSDAYKKRLLNEKKGIKMVISGEYGKVPTKLAEKLERQL